MMFPHRAQLITCVTCACIIAACSSAPPPTAAPAPAAAGTSVEPEEVTAIADTTALTSSPSAGTTVASNMSTTMPDATMTPTTALTGVTTSMTGAREATPTTPVLLDQETACLAAAPIDVLAGQLVWPAVYGEQVSASAAKFAAWGVGGAVLMNWTSATTAEGVQTLKTAGRVRLLIATDEEGGDVQRLKRFGVLPAPATVAATMTATQAGMLVAAHAKVVRALGIDVVFAPVVDVSPVSGSGPIGDRAFSADPAVVSTFASAYVTAWESAGILPVLKHFPGHGSASADSHNGRSRTPPLSVLQTRDLLPYETLASSGAGVMVGHLDVPGLTDTDGVPASMSPAAITGLLRKQLGYTGNLVFTDALGMGAITGLFSIEEAAVHAIGAGADVVVFTSTADAPNIIAALVAAVGAGRLDPARVRQAAAHVLSTKKVSACDL